MNVNMWSSEARKRKRVSGFWARVKIEVIRENVNESTEPLLNFTFNTRQSKTMSFSLQRSSLEFVFIESQTSGLGSIKSDTRTCCYED